MKNYTLVKLVLERANTVLSHLEGTISKPQSVDGARGFIFTTLQDKVSLTQAAQELDYNTLVEELESLEEIVSQEVIDLYRQL